MWMISHLFRGLLQLTLRYGFLSIVEGRTVTFFVFDVSLFVVDCLIDNHTRSLFLYIKKYQYDILGKGNRQTLKNAWEQQGQDKKQHRNNIKN